MAERISSDLMPLLHINHVSFALGCDHKISHSAEEVTLIAGLITLIFKKK